MYSSEMVSNLLWCIMNGITKGTDDITVELKWSYKRILVIVSNNYDARFEWIEQDDHNDDLIATIHKIIEDLINVLY